MVRWLETIRSCMANKEPKTMINETLDLLGMKAKDRVSGFEGVISSVCFDLYGCVQCIVAPPINKDGDLPDSRYFDVQRLDVEVGNRVMEPPDFESMPQRVSEFKHGPAEKPSR